MTKMRRALSIVLLAVAGCQGRESNTERLPTKAEPGLASTLGEQHGSMPPPLVRLVALTAVPERYEGQRIRVTGFFTYADEPEEGGSLNPTKEAADMALFHGIQVIGGNCLAGEDRAVPKGTTEELLANSYAFVQIEGTFRAKGLGPFGMPEPSICNVTRVAKTVRLGDTKVPPARN